MKLLFNLALSLTLVLGFCVSSSAQRDATDSPPISTDRIYEYQDTPDYCFYRQKNPMTDLTEQQVLVFEEYEFPKFIRHNDIALEKDILDYKNAIRVWREANMYRIEEINTAAGTHK